MNLVDRVTKIASTRQKGTFKAFRTMPWQLRHDHNGSGLSTISHLVFNIGKRAGKIQNRYRTKKENNAPSCEASQHCRLNIRNTRRERTASLSVSLTPHSRKKHAFMKWDHGFLLGRYHMIVSIPQNFLFGTSPVSEKYVHASLSGSYTVVCNITWLWTNYKAQLLLISNVWIVSTLPTTSSYRQVCCVVWGRILR